MLKKPDIHSRDDGELHREHLPAGGHPGRRNDLVSEGNNVFDGRASHQVRGAFNFDDGLIGADGVVAVLEVEAEGEVGGVFEKDFADGAVDDGIDRRCLYECSSNQRCGQDECG